MIWRRTKIVVALLFIVPCLIFAVGCGADGKGHLSIRKTSANTWEIYDPDQYPNRYLDKTCDTEGKVVASANTPGEAYEWLIVVCSDSVKPEPTSTPEAYFP